MTDIKITHNHIMVFLAQNFLILSQLPSETETNFYMVKLCRNYLINWNKIKSKVHRISKKLLEDREAVIAIVHTVNSEPMPESYMVAQARKAAQETGYSFESCLKFIKGMENNWKENSSYHGLDDVCIQHSKNPGLMKRLREVGVFCPTPEK